MARVRMYIHNNFLMIQLYSVFRYFYTCTYVANFIFKPMNRKNDYIVTFELYSPYGGRRDLGIIGKKGERVKCYHFQQVCITTMHFSAFLRMPILLICT